MWRQLAECGPRQKIMLQRVEPFGKLRLALEPIDERQHQAIEFAAERMIWISPHFVEKRRRGSRDFLHQVGICAVELEKGRQFIANLLANRLHRFRPVQRFVHRQQKFVEEAAVTPLADEGAQCAGRERRQINRLNLAPLAAGTLRTFVSEGRHRGFLDELLVAVHETLNRPETMEAIRQKIRSELPTLLKLYRADAYVMKKIAASATAFLDEVRTDPNHPFRGEFDRLVLSFIDRLEGQPQFAERLDALKHDLFARAELGELTQHLWSNVKDFVDRNAAGESEVLRHHLTGLLVKAGNQLAAGSQTRAQIHKCLAVVLRSLIADQKSGVSSFISDQVKAWDMAQLISLIEINIGKDLQYIRLNGSPLR